MQTENFTADNQTLFKRLIGMQCIVETDIFDTSDGFCAVNKPVSAILAGRGVATLLDANDQIIKCCNYLDDWYLYSVPGAEKPCCSLFKMREQEYELEQGMKADGDTPGVTISFIAFHTHLLEECLMYPTDENRRNLWQEVNRVVSRPGQKHDPDLKAYFIRPEAQGAYLVAELYVQHIRSFVANNIIPVPKSYAEAWKNRTESRKAARVPDFIDANNGAAGRVICDHQKIFLNESCQLSKQEKLAILATHTGNCSFHSFAAEVRFHAQFLVWYAKVHIPFVGSSPYASAVRADMTIADKEFEGPAPFYDMDSPLMKEQMQAHREAL